jgi:hypothetical protein
VKVARRHVLAPLLWALVVVAAAWVAVEASAAALGRETHLLPLDYRARWLDVETWDPSSEVVLLIWSIVAALGLILLFRQLMRPSVRSATIHETPGLTVETGAAGLNRYIDERLRSTDWIDRSRSRVTVKGRSVDVLTRLTPQRPLAPEDELYVVDAVREAIQRTGLEPGRVRVNVRSTPKRRAR